MTKPGLFLELLNFLILIFDNLHLITLDLLPLTHANPLAISFNRPLLANAP